MKPFVAVIGGRNSGKSTVIRSLTGCPTKSWRDVVEDKSTGRSIYAIASSPRENPLDRDFREIVEQVASDDSIIGLIMAVQPSWPATRLSLEEIFQIAQGKLSPTAVMLHPPYNSGTSPSSQSLEARLKAFSVSLTVLDGRRFAHLNATDIRGLAGIP